MAAYEKSTRPLIDFYQKRGLLVPIMAGRYARGNLPAHADALDGVLTRIQQILGSCSPLGMSRIRLAPIALFNVTSGAELSATLPIDRRRPRRRHGRA